MAIRPFDRKELQGAELVWLLKLTWAGRDFYFSSEPVSPADSNSNSFPHRGGLGTISIENSFPFLSTTPTLQTVPLELLFPGDVDVPLLVAQGHDLGAARGELSRWAKGQIYDRRKVVIKGRVSGVEYGGPAEPVSFSLDEETFTDRSALIDYSARVTADTWTTTFKPGEENKYYPLILGAPGKGTSGVAGSPTLIVDWNDGTSTANKVLISGHRVSATTVSIIDNEGNEDSGLTVTTTTDGLGRTVSLVDFATAGVVNVDRTKPPFYVRWTAGGGVRRNTGSGAYEGAGEVLLYLIGLSTLEIDQGRTEAAAALMDRITIGAYITEPVSAWDWIRSNIIEGGLLPVTMRSGPDGVYPVVWRWEATSDESLETVDADRDAERVSAVAYDGDRENVFNEIRITYARDAARSANAATLTLTAEPDGSTDSFGSIYAQISQSRYGVAVKEIETDIIWDKASAAQVLQWQIRAYGFIPRRVSYVVGQEYTWLEEGSQLNLSDAEMHFSDQVCLLAGLDPVNDAALVAELLLIEDPVRDVHPTS